MWIGVYEFEHCLDVPWRVVLNECIELAKEFGGTDGHKYVNAVLNGVAPESARARGRQRQGPQGSALMAAPMRISQRAQRIEPFHVMEIAKAAALLGQASAQSDTPMVYLNIGEPDFTAPPLVQQAAEKAIRDGVTQYTAATGIAALRERISQWYLQPLRPGHRCRAHRRHGRRFGRAAAGLPGTDRGG